MKKKLLPEDRLITSLECVRMKLEDSLDAIHNVSAVVIDAISLIDEKMDYIERCKRK